MLRELPHPSAGKVPQVVSPLRFAHATLEFERPPPLLGQHTCEVLNELGMDDADIEKLRAQGVL